MPHLLRKVSNRVRSFGHVPSNVTNPTDCEKENCQPMKTKRKRSSLLKTMTDSLKKRRRGSEVVSNDDTSRCSSLIEQEHTISDQNSIFTSPPTLECRTPIRDSFHRKGANKSLNIPTTKTILGNISNGETSLSNLKRIKKCDNLSALTSEHMLYHNISTEQKSTTYQSKNQNFTRLGVSKMDKNFCKDPKAPKIMLKQTLHDSKENCSEYVLPPLVQFRPMKSSLGRIATERRSSVWSKSKCEDGSMKISELPACHNAKSNKESLSMSSPLPKVRKIQFDELFTHPSFSREPKEGKSEKSNQKHSGVKETYTGCFQDDANIKTENISVHSLKASAKHKEAVVTKLCEEKQTTVAVNVNPVHISGLIAPQNTCNETLPLLSEKQADTVRPQKSQNVSDCTATNLYTSEYKSADVAVSDKSYHRLELCDKSKEAAETDNYKANFPFLSPKQIEYIFAKDKDGIPLCRSHSAHNLMGNCAFFQDVQPIKKRNSMTEVDKFNRYIDFLESRQSPNKTTGEVYIGEVMTGLRPSSPKMKSWQTTPNANCFKIYGSDTARHCIGDNPVLPVDIKHSGIAGKTTSELYAVPSGRESYFAEIKFN